jgi:hypothetical protein
MPPGHNKNDASITQLLLEQGAEKEKFSRVMMLGYGTILARRTFPEILALGLKTHVGIGGGR